MIVLLTSAGALLLLSVVGIRWLAIPAGWPRWLGDGSYAGASGSRQPLFTNWLLLFGAVLLVGWVAHLGAVQAFEHSLDCRIGLGRKLFLLRAISSPTRRLGNADQLVYGGLIAVLLLRKQARAQALAFFVCTALGSWGLELSLKMLFHRVRPFNLLGYAVSAYPSGTAMRATIFAGMLLILGLPACRRVWPRRRLWWAAGGCVLLMAASAVCEGKHTLTEIVGGILLGAAWLGLCLRLFVYSGAYRHPRQWAPATPPQVATARPGRSRRMAAYLCRFWADGWSRSGGQRQHDQAPL